MTVADALEAVTFDEGTHVVEQGAPGDEFYIILDGQADVMQRPPDGKDFEKVGQLGPSDLFGWLPGVLTAN